MRRRCRESLAGQDWARLVADGLGRPRWYVKRSYDRRLLSQEAAHEKRPSLEALTDRQRDEALARFACVRRFRSYKCAPGASAADAERRVLAEAARDFPNLRISRSRLHVWNDRLRSGDAADLADNRGAAKSSRSSAEAWAMFESLFLHENQPTIRHCYRIVRAAAREGGWDWPSYRAVARQLDSRIPPAKQMLARDPAAYRRTLQPFLKQDPEAWDVNAVWIGDHKQLDMVCRFNGELIRPWLTTWMDWRTRRVVGWAFVDAPNSTTILAALRSGLKDATNLGGPECVWIDNGKDYDCWLFHGQTKAQRRASISPQVDEPRAVGIFERLGIEAHFSTPYNPNGKARLERWFRTLEAFSKSFETYTGDGPDTKPERLAEVLKFPFRIPTFEAVAARIGSHIAGYNADAEHSKEDLRDGGAPVSPDEAFSRWCPTRRVFADPGALDLLLMRWHRPVTMGRNGIAIALRGQTLYYGQFAPELARFRAASREKREALHVSYDPHDVRSIRVYDSSWNFICDAEWNAEGGGDVAVSEGVVAKFQREKAKLNKALAHVDTHMSITRVLTPEEQLVELAASESSAGHASAPRPTDPIPPLKLAGASQVPEEAKPPRSIRVKRTVLDGQAAGIQREENREAVRMAVGAEADAKPVEERALDLLARNLAAGRARASAAADEDDEDPMDILRRRSDAWRR